MKPKLQFSVPCLGYEEPNDIPCLLYLFYDLPFAELPAPLEFRVANGWCTGQGSFNQSVQILGPDKSVMLDTQNRPFTLENPNKPFLSVFQFQMMVEKEGTHWVRTQLDGETMLEFPFTVRIGQKAEGAQATPAGAQAAQPAPARPAVAPDQQFLMP